MASAFGMATSYGLGGFTWGRLKHFMPDFFRTLLAGKHMVAVHSRMAAVVGAVALGLVAIAFARMGEVAQKLFLQLVAISSYAPFVTPLVFAIVVIRHVRRFAAPRGRSVTPVRDAQALPVCAGVTLAGDL